MYAYRGFLKILLLLLIFGLISFQPLNSVPNAPDQELDTIRIAWMDYSSKGKDRSEDSEKFSSYLKQKVRDDKGGEIEFIIEFIDEYSRYKEVVKRMKSQPDPDVGPRIDITLFTPYTYVLAHEEDPNIKAFLTYWLAHRGGEYASYLIWQTKDGELKDVLKELKSGDRQIVLVDIHSTSGFWWPKVWLERYHEINLDRERKAFLLSGAHIESLRMLVKNKEIIAAAVWQGDFDRFLRDTDNFLGERKLNRYDFKKTQIGPSIPNDALALRGGFPPALQNKIKDVFLKMGDDPEGSNILSRDAFFGIEKWIVADDSTYNPVRSFMGMSSSAKSLKQEYPLEGYILENDKEWKEKQEMRVRIPKEQGSRKYFPVEIVKSQWKYPQEKPEPKKMYAYVSLVDSYDSYLKLLSKSDFNRIRFDIFDNVFYRAKILGPEVLPDKIDVKPYDVNISDKSDFIVDFRVEIFKDNKKAEAGKTGLGFFVEPQKPALFCIREKVSEEKTQIITRDKGQIYIPHGESKAEFCILLKRIFRNEISIKPIHPDRKEREINEVIWFTVVGRFFALAFIGGFIGGLIKFLGSLTRRNSPPGFKRRFAKAVIDTISGAAVGGALFLIVLVLPDLIEQLKTAVPVSTSIGQLGIGVIGGLIGAPGLSGLILRRFFREEA